MATLREQLKRAKQISPKKIEKALFNHLVSLKNELIRINTDRLENKSDDIFNNPIGFYSKATEIISKGSKKAGEPFTLRDTGTFLNSFYIQNVSGVIRFLSRDSKKSLVIGNLLTNEIFGLTDEELKAVVKEKLLPFVVNEIKAKLHI